MTNPHLTLSEALPLLTLSDITLALFEDITCRLNEQSDLDPARALADYEEVYTLSLKLFEKSTAKGL